MDKLPDELMQKLYSYLEDDEKTNLSMTSKSFRQAYHDCGEFDEDSLKDCVKRYLHRRSLDDLDLIFTKKKSYQSLPASFIRLCMRGENYPAWVFGGTRRRLTPEQVAFVESHPPWVKILIAQDGTYFASFSAKVRGNVELAALANKTFCDAHMHISVAAEDRTEFLVSMAELIPSFMNVVDLTPVCADWNFVERIVRVNGSYLRHATFEMRDSEHIVNAAVANYGNSFEHASPRIRASESMLHTAMEQSPKAIQHFLGDFTEYMDCVILLLTAGEIQLSNLPPAMKLDRRIVRAAVNNNADVLLSCPDFMFDPEMLECAVRNRPAFIVRVATTLPCYNRLTVIAAEKDPSLIVRSNISRSRRVMEVAVSKSGYLFSLASDELKNNSGMVKRAVKRNGEQLEYASKRLKGNKEIVTLAIKQTPTAIRHADASMKANEKIARLAITKNGMMLAHVSYELMCNVEIVKAAVTQNGVALEHASEELQRNLKIVKIAVAQNGLALRHAGTRLKNNEEVVKIAVAQNGLALEYASRSCKKCAEVVKIAVAQNGLALEFASEELHKNMEVVKIAVAKNGLALEHASYELQCNMEVVKIAVTQDGEALKSASMLIRANFDLIMMAVKDDGTTLAYASEQLRGNVEIAKVAVQRHPGKRGAYDFVLSPAREDPDVIWLAFGENRFTAYKVLGSNRDYMTRSMQISPSAVIHLAVELVLDLDFMLTLVSTNPKVYVYLPEECKRNQLITEAAFKADKDLAAFYSFSTVPLN